jgi:hypothetical protein
MAHPLVDLPNPTTQRGSIASSSSWLHTTGTHSGKPATVGGVFGEVLLDVGLIPPTRCFTLVWSGRALRPADER